MATLEQVDTPVALGPVPPTPSTRPPADHTEWRVASLMGSLTHDPAYGSSARSATSAASRSPTSPSRGRCTTRRSRASSPARPSRSRWRRMWRRRRSSSRQRCSPSLTRPRRASRRRWGPTATCGRVCTPTASLMDASSERRRTVSPVAKCGACGVPQRGLGFGTRGAVMCGARAKKETVAHSVSVSDSIIYKARNDTV
eukprot:6568626-Prymnesium_polylepis.1